MASGSSSDREEADVDGIGPSVEFLVWSAPQRLGGLSRCSPSGDEASDGSAIATGSAVGRVLPGHGQAGDDRGMAAANDQGGTGRGLAGQIGGHGLGGGRGG